MIERLEKVIEESKAKLKYLAEDDSEVAATQERISKSISMKAEIEEDQLKDIEEKIQREEENYEQTENFLKRVNEFNKYCFAVIKNSMKN